MYKVSVFCLCLLSLLSCDWFICFICNFCYFLVFGFIFVQSCSIDFGFVYISAFYNKIYFLLVYFLCCVFCSWVPFSSHHDSLFLVICWKCYLSCLVNKMITKGPNYEQIITRKMSWKPAEQKQLSVLTFDIMYSWRWSKLFWIWNDMWTKLY